MFTKKSNGPKLKTVPCHNGKPTEGAEAVGGFNSQGAAVTQILSSNQP